MPRSLFNTKNLLLACALTALPLTLFAQSDTTAQASQTIPKKATNAAVTQEEDILLEEGVIEKSVEPSNSTSSALDSASDSTKKTSKSFAAGQPLPATIDTLKSKTQAGPVEQAGTPTTVAVPVTTPLTTATIENAKSINFARNLKEYRSPKIAMLLSLLLPGLGQAYANDYVKCGVFLAAEVALITGGIIYNIQGNDQKQLAHSFADTAYSTEKLDLFYKNLHTQIASKYKANTNTDPQRDSLAADSVIKNFIFSDYDSSAFANAARGHQNDFYDQIDSRISGRNPYVRGWKDCTPAFDANGYATSDTTFTVKQISTINEIDVVTRQVNGISSEQYGFSNNAQRYIGMIDKSESLYQVSNYLFIGILLNRLVSAVDAGITANAYNNKMLERQSFLDRIHLNQNIVYNNGHPSFWYAVTLKI